MTQLHLTSPIASTALLLGFPESSSRCACGTSCTVATGNSSVPRIEPAAGCLRELVWRENMIGEGWDEPPDAVVWIDTARLDAAWARTDQWISPFGERRAQDNRYARFGEWVGQGWPILMPQVAFRDDAVTFVNGRHRFAWLRDHGVVALPVQLDPDDAGTLAASCGSQVRRSLMPVFGE